MARTTSSRETSSSLSLSTVMRSLLLFAGLPSVLCTRIPHTNMQNDSSYVPYANLSLTSTASPSQATGGPPVTSPESTAIPFSERVSIVTGNITKCTQEDEFIHFYAMSGEIIFDDNPLHRNETTTIDEAVETETGDAGNLDNEGQTSYCVVTLTVPSDLVVEVKVLEYSFGCEPDSDVTIYDDATRVYELSLVDGQLADCGSTLTDLPPFTSTRDTLNFQFSFAPSDSNRHALRLTFTAVEPLKLETVFTTPTQGYVQTPGWDGHTQYPKYMDDWAVIGVPAGHVVMLSFRWLHIEDHDRCVFDYLEIYKGEVTPQNNLWSLCGLSAPDPLVIESSELNLHFSSDNTQQMTGFKLLFSFLKPHEIPQYLSDVRAWNCLTPYWENFRQHFLCNLQTECAFGEDEADCPYTSTECGPEQIAVGGRCYLLIQPDHIMSWGQAFETCLVRGAHLVSLNTPQEWHDVTSVLEAGRMSRDLYVGLKTAGPTLPRMYRDFWVWADGSVAYYAKLETRRTTPSCGYFPVLENGYSLLGSVDCVTPRAADILCEVDTKASLLGDRGDELLRWDSDEILHPPDVQADWSGVDHVMCPDGHVAHAFLACDVYSACWEDANYGRGRESNSESCSAPLTSLPPTFPCEDTLERVPYTFVCDHRPDCWDSSDESFCNFPPCSAREFQCGKQCVPLGARCDGQEQCVDGTDEADCSQVMYQILLSPPPPAMVDLDGKGNYDAELENVDVDSFDTFPALEVGVNNLTKRFHQLNSAMQKDAVERCPETHFQCPGNGYCLPVYARCNDVPDCPGKEDEAGCDSYKCPGLYGCRASSVCVHARHMCDGIFRPEHDDELLCNLTCPEGCTCHGLAFTCVRPIQMDLYPDLRYLDAGGTRMTIGDVANSTFLIHLSLSRCDIEYLDIVSLPNLRTLDLGYNRLTSISSTVFIHMPSLRTLSLAGNPLVSLFGGKRVDSQITLPTVRELDLSEVRIRSLDVLTLAVFSELRVLNLSGSGTDQVVGKGFQPLKNLRVLDVRRCPMNQFPPKVFHGLSSLSNVYAANHKLCCPDTLPSNSYSVTCEAPSDEFSSCDALLRSNAYRVSLYVFAIMAILGNLACIVYRVCVHKNTSSCGFNVMVTHLHGSDFLMGVYLVIIGVADRMYQGVYVWHDLEWRFSAACKAAGFLSLLSSELSAFLICLVTLDRFVVLRFPFSQFRFGRMSSHIACLVAWLVALTLAGVPLAMHDWDFYDQNSICIPLPVTRKRFPGRAYAFNVMIVLSFALFLLIAVGQAFIFYAIRSNRMVGSTPNRKSQDLTIARRLIAVVVSDFLCWFPVGLLGLMSSSGMPFPSEVNVGIATFALPFNSAINPFLYTLNIILEKRARARNKQLSSSATASPRGNSTVSVSEVLQSRFSAKDALNIVKKLINDGVLSKQAVTSLVTDANEAETSPVANGKGLVNGGYTLSDDEILELLRLLLRRGIVPQAMTSLVTDENEAKTSPMAANGKKGLVNLNGGYTQSDDEILELLKLLLRRGIVSHDCLTSVAKSSL